MTMHETKKLLSILMESPLYLTLSLKERRSLLTRVAKSYPFIIADKDEETEVGYESSWAGIIHEN